MRTASHKHPNRSNPRGRLRLHPAARTPGGRPVSPLRPGAYHHWLSNLQWANSNNPANKFLRGERGPTAGVRGIPSPFINLDERGRDTPHPSLLPLSPRKDLFGSVLGEQELEDAQIDAVERIDVRDPHALVHLVNGGVDDPDLDHLSAHGGDESAVRGTAAGGELGSHLQLLLPGAGGGLRQFARNGQEGVSGNEPFERVLDPMPPQQFL